MVNEEVVKAPTPGSIRTIRDSDLPLDEDPPVAPVALLGTRKQIRMGGNQLLQAILGVVALLGHLNELAIALQVDRHCVAGYSSVNTVRSRALVGPCLGYIGEGPGSPGTSVARTAPWQPKGARRDGLVVLARSGSAADRLDGLVARQAGVRTATSSTTTRSGAASADCAAA